ncbi:Pca regulon regulatory protein (plasmid) [Variovorax sp. PBL-E5]|nr:Pca regulon regulatory protein [Variovorax sp. PBL-E5]
MNPPGTCVKGRPLNSFAMDKTDMQEEDTKHPMFVTALARGLEILKCFTADRQELGTTEIARETGLAQSTVWRLCYTLTTLGYLVPGRTPDRLRIGAGVLLLGHAAITHTGIAEFAQPLMKELADSFEVSVSLGERYRDGMVIVQRSEARGILSVNLHVGSSLDLANSSLGWAYLAAIGDEAREALMAKLQASAPDEWEAKSRDIAEAIRNYRRSGFVFNLGKSHRDINAIGVPVISADGKRVMALTCGGARSHMTRERLVSVLVPELQALAQRIAPLIPVDEPGGARRKR